jgi:hypothetical protein
MPAGKEITVTTKNETLKVIALEDGSSSVVRIDPTNPRLLEVVATFYDAARAQRYVQMTEVQETEPVAKVPEPKLPVAKASEPKLPVAKVSEPKLPKTSNGQKAAPVAKVSEPKLPKAANGKSVEANGAALDLSTRQSAVLNALRSKMDENKQVEAKASVLAEAAKIPLGSLHSVLGSLEKKQLIVNRRPGTPRAPAVYQVL